MSPITLNATVPPVGTAFGPELDTLVLVAAGRGVNVGVGVARGGCCWRSGVGVNVGEAGGPFAIVMDSSAKPGPGVGEVPPPPPPQLSIIAPKTNNTTGATTSHLSHRENIKL